MRLTEAQLRRIIREEIGFIFLQPADENAVSHDSFGVNDDPEYDELNDLTSPYYEIPR
jgi:hypothetical protein